MLTISFLSKMKELLLKERIELLKQNNLDPTIDSDGDETDEIQANQLIELHTQLNARNSKRLTQIDEALHKINNGTYGECQDCGEFIPEARLLANPYFQTCVFCAEEREAEVKQRKRY